MSRGKPFAFVVSTAGSVMRTVLKDAFLRSQVGSIVADHRRFDAGKLRQYGIPCTVIAESDRERFCGKLLGHLRSNGIEYILSYYTQFYTEELRNAFDDRIINFHPSLLPAFKGMDGFGDAAAYHVRFTGNTVELIDEVMDEGKIIMQTVCPMDVSAPLARTRHVVFIQQCKALIQTVRWLYEDRICVDGRRVIVRNASFGSNEYSPELDYAGARAFTPENSPEKAVSTAGQPR